MTGWNLRGLIRRAVGPACGRGARNVKGLREALSTAEAKWAACGKFARGRPPTADIEVQ